MWEQRFRNENPMNKILALIFTLAVFNAWFNYAKSGRYWGIPFTYFACGALYGLAIFIHPTAGLAVTGEAKTMHWSRKLNLFLKMMIAWLPAAWIPKVRNWVWK